EVLVHRVLQNRDHQASLPVSPRAAADPIEVLSRKQCVGLDDRARTIVECVGTVVVHRANVTTDRPLARLCEPSQTTPVRVKSRRESVFGIAIGTATSGMRGLPP